MVGMDEEIHVSGIKPPPPPNTILMVEDILENMPGSVVTVEELEEMLPGQVNHNKLMVILDCLEKNNKIAIGPKGITWIHNANKNLKKAILEGLEL